MTVQFTVETEHARTEVDGEQSLEQTALQYSLCKPDWVLINPDLVVV